MARFAMIKDGKIENIIIASERHGNEIGGIYCDDFSVNINDEYDSTTATFLRNGVEIEKKSTEDIKALSTYTELTFIKLQDDLDYLILKQEGIL